MQSLLQTKDWAALRQAQGWQAFDIEGISVLQKKLPLGKSFLYAPEVAWGDVSTKLQKICENTKKIAEYNNTIFLRLEILDEFDEKITQKLQEFGFIKAFEEIQPEWRQIIDISKSEDEILAQMKPKGRYNIRVAEKHGIVIEKSDPSTSLGIKDFYQIFRETAKRDGFQIRPKQYFENLMKILAENGIAELWLAKYNEKTIAALIVTFYSGVATYVYGASSNEYRNLMAPYLLHFEVMKRAKVKGCKAYDLLAVMPENREEKIENSDHKYAGISRFKRQFGGRTVHLVGSWDLVYKPRWYGLFKMAEKWRRK